MSLGSGSPGRNGTCQQISSAAQRIIKGNGRQNNDWIRTMLTFLLWCLLLVFCWPLAILAVIVYPLVWLLLLPFRLIGLTFDAVFETLHAVLTLPSRIARRLA